MWSFRLFRFWLGTGECANYSGGNKVVAQWFPMRERALAIGIFNSASMIGSFIAPFLVIPDRDTLRLAHGLSRAERARAVVGGGLVDALSAPGNSIRGSRRAEATYIAPDAERGPMRRRRRTAQLLRLKQTWGLMLCRFWVGPVVQFYIYWMPNYFRDVRHLSVAEQLVLQLGHVPLRRSRQRRRRARRRLADRPGVLGERAPARRRCSTGAGLCLLSFAVPLLNSIPLAIAAISVVLLGHTFLSANMFATVSDVFPDSAVARVTGTHRCRERPQRHLLSRT